ncbi:zinc finger protein 665-like isoform X2 [Periplaneta americana]|uniref:zinc finger protein 665-like isoform X2 n=1 Tax=Periplaneta americana TaxID=6978 RepID=UPI0037E7DA2E
MNVFTQNDYFGGGEENGCAVQTLLPCAVPGCHNEPSSSHKTFFHFPSSEDRCRHWLLVCRRLDLLDKPCSLVSEQYVICSDHFIASQFMDDRRLRLKKGAIPTIFSFNNQHIFPLDIIDGDQIIVEENCEVVVKQERNGRQPFESDDDTDFEEVDEELVVEHPGQLCRLCASSINDVVYIFGANGKEQRIAEKINTSLPVTVKDTDPLPKQICTTCVNKLNVCHEFAESCIQAENKLRELNEKKHFRSHAVYSTNENKANVAIIAIKPEGNDNNDVHNGIDNSLITGNMKYCTGTQGPAMNGIQEVNCIDEMCRGKNVYCCPLCCNGNMAIKNDNATESGDNYDLALLKEIGAKIYKANNVHEEFSTVHGIVVQNALNIVTSEDSNNVMDDDRQVENNLENIPQGNSQAEGEEKIYSVMDGDVTLLNAKSEFPSCRLCGETFASLDLCLAHSKCHMEADLYPCSLCELCFTSELCLVSHCEEHKAEERRLHPKGSKRLVCPTCGRRFNNPRTLAGHNCFSATRPFKCTECGKFFRTEARLEFHQQVHDGGSPVVCEHCGKEFSRENNLFDHVRLVHMGEKAHRCEQCGKSFQLKARLIAHQRVHTGERPFVCDICGGKFYDNATLKGHRVTHMDVKPFQCDKCGRCFARKTLFKQHVIAHMEDSKQSKTYNCKLCTDAVFPTYAKLVEHRKDSHPSVKSFEDDITAHNTKPFKCDDCGKSFAYRVTLVAHRRNHTGELPFNCEFCEKRFSQKRSLVLHRRTHTGEKPFGCVVCGKRFVQSAHLYSHLRLHTGEKPYQCEVCGDSFRLKDVRDAHLRKHTGERPFKCNVCGKAFRTSHSYYQHMWIHQGKKPYPCEYCGKAFRRSNGLKIHIRIHTGEKPHACDICGRCFAQKQDMKKHRNLHVAGKL